MKKAAKIVTLERKAKKITDWLADNDERIGRRGKPVKSNITDNETAKMVSSHGVIQGYNGVVDPGAKIFDFLVLTADSGFNSEASTRAVLDAGIDAYIADPQFRTRDPRFGSQQKHKAKTTDPEQTSTARKYFPAGQPMKSSCPNWKNSACAGTRRAACSV
jgi:hypothetical protein